MIKYILPEELQIPKHDDRILIDLKNKKDDNDFIVTPEWDFQYRVTGIRIEQIVRMTPMKYPEAVDRVWDVMYKRKITNDVLRCVLRELPEDDDRRDTKDTSGLWYTVDGKILIGDCVFKFQDYR